MISYSPEFNAVIILQHAKRHVESRFDGAWWELDKLVWPLVAALPDEENRAALRYIDLQNCRRAERLA